MPDRRLKAVWDVKVPVIRELAGVHEYDGVVMDLSPSGHKAALERLGPSSPGERLDGRGRGGWADGEVVRPKNQSNRGSTSRPTFDSSTARPVIRPRPPAQS